MRYQLFPCHSVGNNTIMRPLSYLSFGRLQVVPGHDVNQEVKLVELCYCHGNVIPL